MPSSPIGPIELFRAAQAKARSTEAFDATACALATVDGAGRPSVRMVLLKGADDRGFVFYANRDSRKGHEIAARPHAALVFWWPSLAEQVRVEGRVEETSDAESDEYFATRDRGSQIGAWASRQSAHLADRAELEASMKHVESSFAGRPVARPPFWGGYRVVPERIEFWRNAENRLHHRLQYRLRDGSWESELLYP